MRPHPVFYLVVLVLMAAQLGWYLPRLPETMASSFGLDGEAGGWSSRTSFVTAYVVSVLVTLLPFLGLPALLWRSGDKGLNIPHPEYWLAPERREATYHHITDQLRWFGLVTILFLVWTHQLVIMANLDGSSRMAAVPFWAGLAAFLGYALWWTMRLVKRFQNRPL